MPRKRPRCQGMPENVRQSVVLLYAMVRQHQPIDYRTAAKARFSDTQTCTRVFAWAGLPASIVGDRDARDRLSASRFCAVCKALNLKLKLSVAYHRQTDGATEIFNKTFLTMLRCFVNQYHSSWADLLPPLLYAYHNAVHSATGFTPHLLLFGWTPRDLRVGRCKSTCMDSMQTGIMPCATFRTVPFQQSRSHSFENYPIRTFRALVF
jgi:hypothetical protein